MLKSSGIAIGVGAVAILLIFVLVFVKMPAAAELAAKKDPPSTLLEMVVAGGWLNVAFMIGLAAISMLAVALVLEQLVELQPKKIIPPAFMTGIRELIGRRELNPDRYRDLCLNHPSPVASVLKSGLARTGSPLPEIEKVMEDSFAREASGMKGKIRILNVIANVSTLLGLLGTVIGILMAFHSVSQSGTGKVEALAGGIYTALETTVAGLVIAIPSLVFAAWFSGKIDRFFRQMDQELSDVLPFLSKMPSITDKAVAAPPATYTTPQPAVHVATEKPELAAAN